MWTRVLTPRGNVTVGYAGYFRRLLQRFGLGRGLAGVQGFQQAEESSGFPDAAELDAEGLDLDEQVLNIDDLVPNQRLEKDADQPDQAVLKGGGDIRATVAQYGGTYLHRLGCGSCTCMYLSLICSQVEIQLEMYRWMNSAGRSTAVVNLRTGTAVCVTGGSADGNRSPADTSPVDHLHGVQRHVHVDEHREILRDLAARHQLQQHLYGDQRVVLHQVRELGWGQTDVIHQPGVLLQLSQQLHI